MCEECKRATNEAIASLVAAWKSATPGAAIIAKCLELGADDQTPTDQRQYAVNQIMLDAYESQRRDAITIASKTINALELIQARLLNEARLAGDKRVVDLEWDAQRNGYTLRGKDINGNNVERFEPLAFGETPDVAAHRIMLGHLEQIGEIHG